MELLYFVKVDSMTIVSIVEQNSYITKPILLLS